MLIFIVDKGKVALATDDCIEAICTILETRKHDAQEITLKALEYSTTGPCRCFGDKVADSRLLETLKSLLLSMNDNIRALGARSISVLAISGKIHLLQYIFYCS